MIQNTYFRFKKVILLLLFVMFGTVQAEPWHVENRWNANIDRTIKINDLRFDNTQAGSTLLKDFNPGVVYQTQFTCPNGLIEKFYSTTLYSSLSKLPLSDLNPGHRKLNDYLDISIQVNYKGAWHYVDFMDVSETGDNYECKASSSIGQIGVELTNTRFGLEGRIQYKLRKKLSQDVLVGGRYHLYSIHGRVDRTPRPSTYGGPEIIRMYLQLDKISVPTVPTCSINNNQMVSIDLKDIKESGIDGQKYGVTKDISIDCQRGVGNGTGKIMISSVKAVNGLLPTSKDNLQIKFSNNGSPVSLNTNYSLTYSLGGVTNWSLTATPIATGPLSEGSFTTTGLIQFTYD